MRSQPAVSQRLCTTCIRPLPILSKVSMFPLRGQQFADGILAFHEPPFRCENEGWGEFDMTIDLYTTEKGGKNTLTHDLNFAKGRYEAKHVVTFKNPSAALINILRESGPVPGDENGAKRKGEKVPRKKTINSVDMEKLADGLVKLGEDDLLQVVQMIHDNKSDETYTKNDIEREYPQFHCVASLTIIQRGSSTSICTPYQTHWSKCFGTLCRAIADHERG